MAVETINNPENISTDISWTETLDSIIQEFEDSWDFILLEYAEILKDIKDNDNISDENINQLSDILTKLKKLAENVSSEDISSENVFTINSYIVELREKSKEYYTSVQEVQTTSTQWEQELKENYWKETLDAIIQEFENSEDFIKLEYAQRLKIVQSNLSNPELNDVAQILKWIHDAENTEEITAFMKELELALYWDLKSDGEDVWFIQSSIEYVWWLLFSSESLSKIEAIEIDGAVENKEDFIGRLNNLKATLETLPEFQSLTEAEQNTIMQWLQKISEQIKDSERFQNKYLDETIDSFAKQVENANDTGTVEIQIGDWSIDFINKQDAFDFLLELKSHAEDEFENAWPNLLESAWDAIWYLFSSGFWTTTVLNASLDAADFANHNPLFDIETEPEDWIFSWESIFNNTYWFITYFLAIAATVNYAETIYRRVLLDTLARRGVNEARIKNFSLLPFAWDTMELTEWNQSVRRRILRIPDYNIDDVYLADSNDAELRNEYIQRVRAIQKLEETLKTIEPSKRPAFEEELWKVKSYLNINTKTFWLKAWSLDKNHYFPRRWINALVGWPNIFWRHLRDNATQHFNLDKSWREELKKWLEFLFDWDFSIEVDEKTKALKIVWNPKFSSEIDNLKSYITSRTDLSEDEKASRIKKVDNLVERVRNNPIWWQIVKLELYNIIERGYLSTEDVQSKIDKKLGELYPHLSKKPERRSWAEWRAERWRSISEIWWKNAPPALTKKTSMLYSFSQIVSNNNWEGNEKDLQTIFDKVDNWNLELQEVYVWRKKALVWDFFTWFFSRYWISTPELNQLKRFSPEITQKDFEDMIKRSETIWKNNPKILRIISQWIEVNWKMYNPIQAIRNYISYTISDIEEEKIWEKLRKYLKDIEDKKIIPSENEFFREVEKIKKWFIPTHQAITELQKIQDKDWMSDAIKKYALELQEHARKWKLNITQWDLKLIESWNLSVWQVEINEFSDTDKRTFVTSLEQLENYHEYDYKERLTWLSYDIEYNLNKFQEAILKTYKSDLDRFKVIYSIQDKDFDLEAKLKDFAKELKNRYTSWQAKQVLERIFNGEDFSSIKSDLQKITSDASISPDEEFKIDSMDRLNKEYSRIANVSSSDYDELKARQTLEFIRNSEIDITILPDQIKTDLKNLDWLSETATNISRQQGEIRSIIEEVKTAQDSSEVWSLKNRLDAFIKDEKITRTSVEFEDLIQEFVDERNNTLSVIRTTVDETKSNPIDRTSVIESKDSVPSAWDFIKYLNDIYPSVLMSQNDDAIQKVEEIYSAAFDSKFREDIWNIRDFETYCKAQLLQVSVFPEKLPNFNSSKYTAVIDQIPAEERFARFKSMKYSDLVLAVRTAEPSVKTAILDAIDKFWR